MNKNSIKLEDNFNHVIVKRQTRDYDDYEFEVDDRRDDLDGTVKKLLESEEHLH